MKKILSLLFCFLFVFSVGCSSKKAVSKKTESTASETEKLYEIKQNEDLSYNFKVYTLDGDIIISEKNYPREVNFEELSDSILKLCSGTGASTKWTRYVDLKDGRASDTFYGVIGEKGDAVIITEYRENKHFVTVKKIFEPTVIIKETALENASVDADVTLESVEESSITVKYFSGLKRTPQTLKIDI